MGIISLNDKRGNTTSSSYLVTGREKGFHSGEEFPEIVNIDPYISGKFYYYHDNGASAGGRFGAFWDTGLAEQDLTIVAGASSFSQRTTRWHTSDNEAWQAFTIDLSSNSINTIGRLVFYAARDDNKFNSDFDIDDIKLHAANNTIVNLDPSGDDPSEVRSGNLWQRSDDAYVITSYANAKSNYPSSSSDFETVPTGVTNGMWQYFTGTSQSSGTGADNAADNSDTTYRLYWEGSSGGDYAGFDKGAYVRWTNRYNKSTGAVV